MDSSLAKGSHMAKVKSSLIDMQFGKLKVLSEAQTRIYKGRFREYRLRYFNCICSCPAKTIREYSAKALKAGDTRSCGCLVKELNRERNRKASGESGLRDRYNLYRFNAKVKGVRFLLTLNQFRKLVTQNCYYCQCTPSNLSTLRGKSPEAKAWSSFLCSGIDRIDSDLDYSPGNVRSCCWTCNVAKGDKTHEEFLQYLQDLTHAFTSD